MIIFDSGLKGKLSVCVCVCLGFCHRRWSHSFRFQSNYVRSQQPIYQSSHVNPYIIASYYSLHDVCIIRYILTTYDMFDIILFYSIVGVISTTSIQYQSQRFYKRYNFSRTVSYVRDWCLKKIYLLVHVEGTLFVGIHQRIRVSWYIVIHCGGRGWE